MRGSTGEGSRSRPAPDAWKALRCHVLSRDTRKADPPTRRGSARPLPVLQVPSPFWLPAPLLTSAFLTYSQALAKLTPVWCSYRKPSRIKSCRVTSAWGALSTSAATVARPVGVTPWIAPVSRFRTKCSGHGCSLGLNKGTISPLTTSMNAVLTYLEHVAE